jgi:hypothetical protein
MKSIMHVTGVPSGPIWRIKPRPVPSAFSAKINPAYGTALRTTHCDPKPIEFDAVNGMEPSLPEWVHPACGAKGRAAVKKLGRRIAAAAAALGRAIDFYAVGHPTSAQEDDP